MSDLQNLLRKAGLAAAETQIVAAWQGEGGTKELESLQRVVARAGRFFFLLGRKVKKGKISVAEAHRFVRGFNHLVASNL